jgi:hypothetical protein
MRAASLAVLALCFAAFYGAIEAQVRSSAATPGPHEREALKPLTVCEVLENLSQHAGKMVAVVGRLSWSMFDGQWLSENSCSSKVPPSDPDWPYAIFVGFCSVEKRPPAMPGKLKVDAAVLEAKLIRLRKTTSLGYYGTVLMPRPGEGGEPNKIRQKETWSVLFGRIEAAPPGKRGGFGAVRAQAQLCSGDGPGLDIEEPDPTWTTH